MKNKSLVTDYIERSRNRLLAIQVLYDRKSYADVVRESQEVVELVLKAVLRASHIEIPRIHDVSNIMNEEINKLPKIIQDNLKDITSLSRALRRDRELSFYGSEDLTPSEFYKEADAKEAYDKVKWLVNLVVKAKIS